MNRREFLKLSSAVAAPLALRPLQALAVEAATGPAVAPHQAFDRYFLQILDGFLRNSTRAGPGFAVCDFPDGTIVKTNADHTTTGTPTLGPYINEIPEAFGSATVTASTADPLAVTGTAGGWLYNAATGEIRVNHTDYAAY